MRSLLSGSLQWTRKRVWYHETMISEYLVFDIEHDDFLLDTVVRGEQRFNNIVNLLEGKADVGQDHVLLLRGGHHLELPVHVSDGALQH